VTVVPPERLEELVIDTSYVDVGFAIGSLFTTTTLVTLNVVGPSDGNSVEFRDILLAIKASSRTL
jgi:hypothetical protein